MQLSVDPCYPTPCPPRATMSAGLSWDLPAGGDQGGLAGGGSPPGLPPTGSNPLPSRGRLTSSPPTVSKYSRLFSGSATMVFSPGFQPAGHTSPCSATYWTACRGGPGRQMQAGLGEQGTAGCMRAAAARAGPAAGEAVLRQRREHRRATHGQKLGAYKPSLSGFTCSFGCHAAATVCAPQQGHLSARPGWTTARLQRAQRLVHVAADGEVVHGDVLQGALQGGKGAKKWVQWHHAGQVVSVAPCTGGWASALPF